MRETNYNKDGSGRLDEKKQITAAYTDPTTVAICG